MTELKDDLPLFIHLYRRIKKEGLDKQDITKLLENQNKLVDFDKYVNIHIERTQDLRLEKQLLGREIDALRKERDNYDTLRHYKKECC
jgi:hypothetical protein